MCAVIPAKKLNVEHIKKVYNDFGAGNKTFKILLTLLHAEIKYIAFKLLSYLSVTTHQNTLFSFFFFCSEGAQCDFASSQQANLGQQPQTSTCCKLFIRRVGCKPCNRLLTALSLNKYTEKPCVNHLHNQN